MTRSIAFASLFAVMGFAFTAPDAEARCCRARHHNRCCGSTYGYGSSYSYQYTSAYQNGGACCQNGMTTTQFATATSGSTPWVSNSASNQNYRGYAAPTNVETRPTTSLTAPAAGPAPAGTTTAEEAPRPGI